VFSSFFNDEKRLLEAYSAIKGKNYPDDAEVEINTLEDVLFMERINDVSFLLDNKLIVLIEHQAYPYKNLPVRLLLYISKLYEMILKNENVYKSKLIKIPKPDFIVLYNGDKEYPDTAELKLSDAFEDVDIPDLLELTVRVYNINDGRNKEILEKSKSLSDYAAFIDLIKKNKTKGFSLEKSVKEAIKYCIANGIMKEYLEAHASEVSNMLYAEFNMDDALQMRFEEGKDEALESVALKMLMKGDSPKDVAEIVSFPIDKVMSLSKSIQQN
jgi:predicted transposase/invertase (TIGR01784 family)